jgi:hypothetical protein
MKPYLWSAVLLLTICCGCGGRSRSAAAAGPDTTYTHIPGTRLSMLIPPAFEITPYGIGHLVNDRGEEIVIMDIIGGSYYENAKNFTPENLDQLTSAPVSFQKLEIQGYEASFSQIESKPFGQGNMMLVFGDSTFCAMTTIIYRSEASDSYKNILKNTLLSVRYDPQRPIDPAEFAPFTVAENASGFEFDDYSAGMFVYRDRDLQKIIISCFSRLPGMTVDDLLEEHKRQWDFQYTGDTALSLIDGQEVHEHLMVGDRSDEGVQLAYLAVVTDIEHRQSVSVNFQYFSKSGRPTLEDEEVAGARAFVRAIKTDANENTE